MATLFDKMTRTSQNGLMPDVNVTNLKARLSHYLRLVRGGESIVVFDRDKPVAEIIPYRRKRLTITPPSDTSGPWYEVPTGPPLPPEVFEEAMKLLREDRDSGPAWKCGEPGEG